MSIIASCGHEITLEWMLDDRSNVEYWDWSRDCKKVRVYSCECEPCIEWRKSLPRGTFGRPLRKEKVGQ